MEIFKNYSLKNYNTFGIDAIAREFVSITSIDELKDALSNNTAKSKLILGGGSNMLLTKDVDAMVIHINLQGKEIVFEDVNDIYIKCNAGENWHQFVLFAIENNWGGIENMSLIPGNVGTTPVQNIGAYGAEIKDVMISCEALNVNTFELVTFSNTQCNFGYRESIFKAEAKDQFIITSVTFKLTKNNHIINTNYGDILGELQSKNILEPTIKDVSDAIILIRQKKLPDPKELGNSGSFFKNPILSKNEFATILQNHPDIKFFDISPTQVKVPAGYLIEQTGMKGYREGDAGVHKNQALVLVNYGNATGQEIVNLSKLVQQKVFEKFQIKIEPEVNIL